MQATPSPTLKQWRERDEAARQDAGKKIHEWRTKKDGKRVRGISWNEHVAQGDMFNTPSPAARILGDLLAAAEDERSFDREDVESEAGKEREYRLITKFLEDYIAVADAADAENGDIFGDAPPSIGDVLGGAREKSAAAGRRFSIALRLDEERKKLEAEGGRLVLAHHGTDTAGFTVFRNRVKTGFFFAKSRETAGSYIRVGNRSDIYAKGVPPYTELLKEKEDDGEIEHGWALVRKDGDLSGISGIFGPLFQNRESAEASAMGREVVEAVSYNDKLYRADKGIPYSAFLNDPIENRSGVYEVALRMERPYIIDCKGANWDNIIDYDGVLELGDTTIYDYIEVETEDGIYYLGQREHGKEDTEYESFETLEEAADFIRKNLGEDLADDLLEHDFDKNDKFIPVDPKHPYYFDSAQEAGFYLPVQTTDDVVQLAFDMDCDGVIFKNLVDNGGGVVDADTDDIYVVKKSNQIKLVDEMTYADDGTIIPAEKRLDWNDPDIRFSTITLGGRVLALAETEPLTTREAQDETKVREVLSGVIGRTFLQRGELKPVKVDEKFAKEFWKSNSSEQLRRSHEKLWRAKVSAIPILGDVLQTTQLGPAEAANHINKEFKKKATFYRCQSEFGIKRWDGIAVYPCELILLEVGGNRYVYDIVNIKKPTLTAKDALDENILRRLYDSGTRTGESATSVPEGTAHSLSQTDAPRQGGESTDNRRFSIGGVFTGSAADYDKPSLHYVGTGEGSQVYGWGLYGSNVRGVAEGYMPRERTKQEKAYIEFLKRSIANEKFPELKKHWEGELEFAQRRRRNLYEQTFFTNRAPGDESHLLKWYEPVSEEQKVWIENALREMGATIEESNLPSGYKQILIHKPFSRHGLSSPKAAREEFGGGDYYEALKAFLGSPKAASEFLARVGIDGVKYPVNSYGQDIKDGDKYGWNYVSFRDDNIRVDHKWTDGQQRFSVDTVKPWPQDFPNATLMTTRSAIASKHSEIFNKAKAGDVEAAEQLISTLMEDKTRLAKVLQLKKDHPNAAIAAAVHAEESSGRNKIPVIFAQYIAKVCGMEADGGIVQTVRAQHTGKDAWHRLTHRAQFSGEVQKGKEYILVDDHITQGGTINELRSYIENNGGKVVAVAALTASKGSGILSPRKATIDELKRKYSDIDQLLRDANIAGRVDALTNSEAEYINKFLPDIFRNRVAQARQERSDRTRQEILGGSEADGVNQSRSREVTLTQQGGYIWATGRDADIAGRLGFPVATRGGKKTAAFPEHLLDTQLAKFIRNGISVRLQLQDPRTGRMHERYIAASPQDGQQRFSTTITPEALAQTMAENRVRLAKSHAAIEEDRSGRDADGRLRNHGLEGLEGDAAVDKLYELAKENAPALKSMVNAAAAKCGGKASHREGLKKRERVIEKMNADCGGDARRVVDLIGGTIALSADKNMGDALKALRASLPEGSTIAQVKKCSSPANGGYWDLKVSVRFPNGGIGEVIVIDENILEVKNNRGGHELYDFQRELDPLTADITAADLFRKLQQLEHAIYSYKTEKAEEYQATWERAKASASSSLTRLAPSLVEKLSSGFIGKLKELLDGSHLQSPASLNSQATPFSSFIQKDISNTSSISGEDGEIISQTAGKSQGGLHSAEPWKEESRPLPSLISSMSDDELVSAALAVKIALSKSEDEALGKVTQHKTYGNVMLKTVVNMLRKVHPDWDNAHLSREAGSVARRARWIASGLRGDMNRGVSESLIVKRLPKTLLQDFDLDMRAHSSQGDMFNTPAAAARMLGDLFSAAEDLRSFDKEDNESDAHIKSTAAIPLVPLTAHMIPNY